MPLCSNVASPSRAAQARVQPAGPGRDLAQQSGAYETLLNSVPPVHDNDTDILVAVPQRPLRQSGLEHWTSKERLRDLGAFSL